MPVRASTNTGKFNFTTARIPRGYLYEILTKLWKSYPRVHLRSSFIGHGTGVSPSIRNMVKQFKVLSLTNLSDHRPILCQLSVRIQMIAAELIQELHQDAPKRPKWDGDATAQQFTDNLNKAEITNQLLDISTSTLDTVENIYSTNKKFVHILESALGTDQPSNCANSEQKIRCFSKKKRRSKLRPKQKWFDAECITTKRELNILTRKYGKTPRTTFYVSAFTLGRRTIKNC